MKEILDWVIAVGILSLISFLPFIGMLFAGYRLFRRAPGEFPLIIINPGSEKL